MPRRTGKIIGLAIGLVCICAAANAQKIDLYGGVGYASYRHPELHDYQDEFVKVAGVSATKIQQFPSYYTYMAGLEVALKPVALGVEFGHGSTGGRVYYEDYSGNVVGDMTVIYNYFAITPSVFVYRTDDFSIAAGAKLSIIYSKLAVANSKRIGETTLSEGEDFYGTNFGFQPNVVAQKILLGRLILRASAGYEFQNSSAPVTKKDKLFLSNGNNGEVHLKGDGFRLSIGVGIRILK